MARTHEDEGLMCLSVFCVSYQSCPNSSFLDGDDSVTLCGRGSMREGGGRALMLMYAPLRSGTRGNRCVLSGGG